MKKLSVVSFVFALVAMVLSGAAVYMSSPKGVEKTLVSNPKILISAGEAVEKEMRAAEAERQAKAREEAQVAIAENIEQFNNDPLTPFTGPADAKVVMVEFFDFACGYCHALAPTLEKLTADNADIKVVFKPLAFLSRESGYAASAFVAANMQGKGYDFYKAVMAINNGLSEEKINNAAEKAGVDVEQMKKDMTSADVEKTLRGAVDLAQKANVNGVPLLILNGKIVQSVDSTELQKAIDALK